MIPNNYFFITHSCLGNGRSEIVFKEITLIRGGINAGFPSLSCHRFILNCHSPDRNAFFFICFNKFYKIVCPWLVILRFKFTAMKHIVVIFHICRWTPWTDEQCQAAAGCSDGFLNKRDTEFLIMFNCEGFQFIISFSNISIAAA